jgi:hypothetical protein
MDEEHTKCNRQREQRVMCMIWQRTVYDKNMQNKEEDVGFCRELFMRVKAGRVQLLNCTEEA